MSTSHHCQSLICFWYMTYFLLSGRAWLGLDIALCSLSDSVSLGPQHWSGGWDDDIQYMPCTYSLSFENWKMNDLFGCLWKWSSLQNNCKIKDAKCLCTKITTLASSYKTVLHPSSTSSITSHAKNIWTKIASSSTALFC